jgi:hypothetical protein
VFFLEDQREREQRGEKGVERRLREWFETKRMIYREGNIGGKKTGGDRGDS